VTISAKLRILLILAVTVTALAACGKKAAQLDYPPGTPEGTHPNGYPASDSGQPKNDGWGFP